MNTGATITTTITDLAFGGDGVGRVDTQVVFIPFTAVGDVVEAQVVSQHRQFCRAVVLKLLQPGPGRVDPVCPHFGRCGGCRYQHLTSTTQLQAKQAQLQAQLQRLARLGAAVPAPDPVVPSPNAWHYRNKLRVEPIVPAGATPGSRGTPEYGFIELDNRTGFHLDRCPLAAEPLNQALHPAQQTAAAERNAQRRPPLPLTLRQDGTGTTTAVFGRETGVQPCLTEQLLDRQVAVPVNAFWQINPGVAQHLFRTVRTWFEADPTPLLVDAYSGAGAFSLAVGACAHEHVLIETDPDALAAAIRNHQVYGLARCHGHRGRVEALLPQVLANRRGRNTATTVILDPPRTGCAPAVIACLNRTPVAQVLYVSCNPATLARDLRSLCGAAGYHLERIALFDMFPQTAHFETVALLRR